MNGSSSVSGNDVEKSGYVGGGIDNYRGTITMNFSSSVTGNLVAEGSGGGIHDDGALTMTGSSSVTGNRILVDGSGGGILVASSGTFNACTAWSGAISPNTPDDPPAPSLIPC